MRIFWVWYGAVLGLLLVVTVSAQPAPEPPPAPGPPPPPPPGPGSPDKTLHCYVCSNSKSFTPLYHDGCLKSPDKLTEKITDPMDPKPGMWPCHMYGQLLTAAIQKASSRMLGGRSSNPPPPTTSNQTSCEKDEYAVCRSYYYEADSDYLQHDDKDLGKLTGSNEKVFRYCGCIKDTANPGTTEENRKKLREKILKGKEKDCEDYKQGSLRKRYCVCYGKDPSKPCNLAPSFRSALLTQVFAVAGMAFSLFRLF